MDKVIDSTNHSQEEMTFLNEIDYIYYIPIHFDAEMLSELSAEDYPLLMLLKHDNSSIPLLPGEDPFMKQMEKVNIFLTPVIIAVGIIFNMLSMMVYLCTRLKHHSSSVYLVSLAVVDSLFLLTLVISWLSWINVHVIDNHGMCQITIYAAFVTSFLSVYIVVAFTVERFIAVVFPLKRATFCSKKRAKICVAVLVIIALLLYSFSLWTNKVVEAYQTNACTHLLDEWTGLRTTMIYIDAIVTLAIPSVTIITLNITITVKLYRVIKTRKQLMQRREESSACNLTMNMDRTDNRQMSHSPDTQSRRIFINRNGHQQMHCPGNQLKNTLMLLIVSTVFLVLNIPSHVLKLILLIHGVNNDIPMKTEYVLVLQEISQLLYYLSFSINFFLYSVCASHFRQGLKELHQNVVQSCCRQRARRNLNGQLNVQESVTLVNRRSNYRVSHDMVVQESVEMELSVIRKSSTSINTQFL